MSNKYDELSLRSAGNENLKIIAELFKEKQKTIAKTFIKHEKKIIGEPMKGSQLSVLKSNSAIWRDSSSKSNLLKSLRIKEEAEKTSQVEEQEYILPSLKNISSSANSTVPRQSSTVEDQSEIFPSQSKNQPIEIEPEIEKKQDKSASQSGSQESKQEMNKNSLEDKKIMNKEQISAQQQQAEKKKKQVEEDNKQKMLAEQEELKRQQKEKQQQQQDLERKKQEQSRQIEQQQQEQVLKQQEIDEKDKKQSVQEDVKKQENKVLEKQDSEEDFDDFQDAEMASPQQEEKQQQPQQQQQQSQIQSQIKNTNNPVDDDFDIFDAPPSKQNTIQVQPQKPAAQFLDWFEDTPQESHQKEDNLNSNNQGNKNENQLSSNNPSGHLSLYDFQPKKQETVDLQPLSSDNQLDPSAVSFLKSLPDIAYVLSKSLCYPQTLFS